MKLNSIFVVAAAALLTACATPVQPLYQWGAFPSHTYDALRGEGKSPAEQVEAMTVHAEKVAGAGQQLPPGFRAHLGLLLLKLGRRDEAQQQFDAERKAFPEAAIYIEQMQKAQSGRNESEKS